MTLCIGWVRRVGDYSEICIAADSCLSGGQRFLAAPKIFPLSRKDCAIACAGATGYSFPIVEHIIRAIEINQKLRDRAGDVTDLIHLIEDIANSCLHAEQEPEYAIPGEGPGFSMIIGGYSWKTNSPILRRLTFDWHLHKMKACRVTTLRKIPIAVIGDNVGEVRGRLYRYLKGLDVDETNVNMEPLEVLIQCINDTSEKFSSIAGNPQMVKIYPYPNVLPIGILQRAKPDDLGKRASSISYFGRNLLSYETFPYPIYDIETKEMRYMYQKQLSEDFIRHHEEVDPLKDFKNI